MISVDLHCRLIGGAHDAHWEYFNIRNNYDKAYHCSVEWDKTLVDDITTLRVVVV